MVCCRSCIWLLVDKVSSGIWILCFVSLFLTVSTVPLFRKILLLKAHCVEPFPFTVGVLACHHFSKRMSTAIAVLGFFGHIIEKIFFFDSLRCLVNPHLGPSSLKNLFFRLTLAFVLELVVKLTRIIIDLKSKLLSKVFFLFHVSKELALFFGDIFKLNLHCWGQFRYFSVLEFLSLLEEPCLQGKERSLNVLCPLIKLANETEKAVDIIGDSDHLVHKVIQVAIGSCHTKLSKYYKSAHKIASM